MLNHQQAKKEMREKFYTRYKDYVVNGFPDVIPVVFTQRNSSTPYIPEVKWDNIQKKETIDNSVHWMRFMSHNVRKQQKSLTGGRVQAVGTTYTSQGIIVVELFFSKSAYQTADYDFLNLVVERCFIQANTPGGVWFRNSMILELNPEENYFRSNVMAEYLYDSVIT